VESFGLASSAIGSITPGMALFAVTRGQWSMIDAILHVLDQVGPSRLSLWTWTVAEYEIQTLTRLREDDRVTAGRLVIDAGARVKNARIIAEWRRTFGSDSVRFVTNHAKIATVASASGLHLLLRGSMNLNFNPRFEQFDLTEGGPDFDLIDQIERDLPSLAADCSNAEVWAASRVAEAFDSERLALFSALKVWAK
jgi:hypothetical protein